MRSFLTEPLLKNNPHKQNNVIIICICMEIDKLLLFLYRRPSCWLKELWIMKPIWMNKQLLNKAWLTKWKRDRKLKPNPTVVIEKPIWERVLKATTFFISSSNIAVILEKNIVKHPKFKIIDENLK